MFNWPDGDIILRATHDTDARDFRVHKIFLSFASPVFKDMFKLPQPPSATSTVDIIDMNDPPRALDAILRFIYPAADPPTINDVAFLSEVLILADKYQIDFARSRLRPLLMEFAKADPLRTYAIACRLGFEAEMKVASWNTRSINLLGLTELPDEFKHLSCMEYHRLVLLHVRYWKEVEAVATSSPPPWVPPLPYNGGSLARLMSAADAKFFEEGAKQMIVNAIKRGGPLDYESLLLTIRGSPQSGNFEGWAGDFIRAVLDKADALNLTV